MTTMTTSSTKRTSKRKQKQNKMNDTIQNEEEKHTRKGKKQKNNLFSGIYHARLDIKKFISYILHVFIRTFKTEEQEWHREENKKHNKATKQYRNAKEKKTECVQSCALKMNQKKKTNRSRKGEEKKILHRIERMEIQSKVFWCFFVFRYGCPVCYRPFGLFSLCVHFIYSISLSMWFCLFVLCVWRVSFFCFFFSSVHRGDVLTIVDVVDGEIDEINLYWFFSF